MLSKHAPYFLLALAALLVLGGARYLGVRERPTATLPAEKNTSAHFLDRTPIEAKAAVLYDPEKNEVLWQKNAEAQLPLASLAKLATAAAALDGGKDDFVVIELRDIQEEGDSGLSAGEVWKLPDLVRFALRTSSNDAAAALARASLTRGKDDLNGFARRLNLAQTFFLNPTGLDVSSTTAGAYGSALDVARLLSYIIRAHPEALDTTLAKAHNVRGGESHATSATASPLKDIPGLLGAKTGFTDLAGGNLAVAFERGLSKPLIAVVLGSSRDGRFSDIRTIIDAVRSRP